MHWFHKIFELQEEIEGNLKVMKSDRIKNLLGKRIFPKIKPKLIELENSISWKDVQEKQLSSETGKAVRRIPEPAKGSFKEFDKVNDRIDEIKLRLNNHLEALQEKLGCPQLKFVFVSYHFKY